MSRKAQLYLRGFPALLEQIRRLVALAPQDTNIGALILYGSTARLTPRSSSDADVLILCQNPQRFNKEEDERCGFALILEATSAGDEWSFAPYVTDLAGSDLPSALLRNIARDGVLLYSRPGLALPTALAKARPYQVWHERVQTLLEQYQQASQPVSV
ncbi:MAG TPA: nucleotidyltransferase domain-containing protein [Ktedonobacterales bacterium]|nr:nucleotidyltransferase domain-containing protein [Ktedonobacterales bacterium]